MLTAEERKLNEQISANTIALRVKDWIEQFFENLSCIKQGTGIAVLHQALTGVPMIIVGAGPSLDKNLLQLQEYQDKACIVACDASLEALLKANCRPHIVLCADSKERVIQYLTPEDFDTSDLLLIADTRIHPKTREAWKGKILWYNSMPVENFPFSGVTGEWTGNIGFLGSGGCVTSTIWCMSIAVTGNQPHIFVGQDCSFPDPESHHANAVRYTEKYDVRGLVPEIDINGKEVFTMSSLQSFRNWFEEMFPLNPGVHINCTEGGVLRRGCLIMKLEQAAKIFLQQSHDIKGRLDARMELADDIMGKIHNGVTPSEAVASVVNQPEEAVISEWQGVKSIVEAPATLKGGHR